VDGQHIQSFPKQDGGCMLFGLCKKIIIPILPQKKENEKGSRKYPRPA
jgi:hypothetical protein